MNRTINVSFDPEEINLIADVLSGEYNMALAEVEKMSARDEAVFPNAPISAAIAQDRADKLSGIIGRLKNA